MLVGILFVCCLLFVQICCCCLVVVLFSCCFVLLLLFGRGWALLLFFGGCFSGVLFDVIFVEGVVWFLCVLYFSNHVDTYQMSNF